MYSNFTVSTRSVVPLFVEADLGMFSMFGRTGAPQKEGAHAHCTGHRTSDIILRPVRASPSVLRHSFRAARQSVAYKYYTTSEFRKPHLKSGNSSNTAYSCNAEFMVSFCRSTLMSENLCEAPHFYRTGPTLVRILSYQHVSLVKQCN